MSPEEATREAERREHDAVAREAAVASTPAGDENTEAPTEKGKEKEKTSGWAGSLRRLSAAHKAPPAPTHRPPPPPPAVRSPQAEAMIQKGEREAQKSPMSEEDVPHRTLKTTSPSVGIIIPATTAATATPAGVNGIKHASQQPGLPDRRESTAQALPVVDEAGEGSSNGEVASRDSRLSSRTMESDGRPLTPAKDGEELGAGFGNPILTHGSRKGGSPPTPPVSTHLKPESADSGYGVTGIGNRSRSGTTGSGSKVRVQLSRESLDKALPPLPRLDSGNT
jgi:1-phosphatidylinositol-4-phosphate 5-kinase